MPSAVGPRTVAVFAGGGTGGHLYPALALAEAMARLRPDLSVFFVGARQGLEARVLPERRIGHLLLPVRGFRRERWLANLPVLWDLVRSVLMAGELFSRLRPGLVVVTGGYAAGPAGLAAGAMGIPLALQEQNARPGFTNRVLSRWARQIHLAFPEARGLLPPRARSRASISGNPVRERVQVHRSEAAALFGLDPAARVLLVVGGSQGARGINRAVLDGIRRVEEGQLDRPEDLVVLWATGPDHLEDIQDRLEGMGAPAWVRTVGYIEDIPAALTLATLAVGRAGAMTTAEFLAWGVPAILVPLPTAAADHQSRNAESLSEVGAAIHMPEATLDGATLWAQARSLLDDPHRLEAMKRAASTAGRPQATREIAEALAGLLPPSPFSVSEPEAGRSEGGAP